ncbi:MAG: tyrosine-type recombinase/integrase [Nocardioidaceae bacterium]
MSAPVTFERKRDADRWLSATEVEMVRGTWIDQRRAEVTLGDWADRWLATASHLRPKTVVGYRSLLRSVIEPSLGNRQLGDIRRSGIQAWVASLTERGLSPSRIRQSYRLLSQLMKAAELDGIVSASPCVGIRLPRVPEHEPNVLTPEQVTRLAALMRTPYDVLVLTLAYTGLRFGEAVGLRRCYVRLDQALIVVASSLSDANGAMSMQEPKTHQHRLVTLPSFLVERLRDHVDHHLVVDDREALMFTSPDGLPLRHQNFMRRVWYPACSAAGVSATPHDLRATHATWLYDAGWSPVEIAARLGHAKATVTTKHYARRVAGRDVQIASGLDQTFKGTTQTSGGHAEGTRDAAAGTDGSVSDDKPPPDLR